MLACNASSFTCVTIPTSVGAAAATLRNMGNRPTRRTAASHRVDADRPAAPGLPTSPAAAPWRPTLLEPPAELAGRYLLTEVAPVSLGGRRPAAAAVGEAIPIRATAFREGHDSMGVTAILSRPDGSVHERVRLTPEPTGLDTWVGQVRPDAMGDWSFTLEAWGSPWDTWVHRATIKIPADVDVDLEFTEGSLLLERAAAALPADATSDRALLTAAASTLIATDLPIPVRLAAGTDPAVADLLYRHPMREGVTRSGPWPLRVQRRRALVGAWYEFFPRSEGATLDPPRSGTFQTATARLDAVAEMGFDVVYLPPVHPDRAGQPQGAQQHPHSRSRRSRIAVGHRSRRGRARRNPPRPRDDRGLRRLRRTHARTGHGDRHRPRAAGGAGPPVGRATHPEWFTTRADGTIAYAENPPKKYQDIYPLNFDNDPEGLYAEVERIVRYWMSHGVRIFRVDNPHTKPLWVWDRLLNGIFATDPDVLFLAEAFTRPPMMRALAQVGFQQSYTYFTWRNDRVGDRGVLPRARRARGGLHASELLRQHARHRPGVPPALRSRRASRSGPRWRPRCRPRTACTAASSSTSTSRSAPAARSTSTRRSTSTGRATGTLARKQGRTLAPYLTQLNEIRTGTRRCRTFASLRFHAQRQPRRHRLLQAGPGDDTVLVICTLDPGREHEATVWWDLPALGLSEGERFVAHDLDHRADLDVGAEHLRAAATLGARRPRRAYPPHLTLPTAMPAPHDQTAGLRPSE